MKRYQAYSRQHNYRCSASRFSWCYNESLFIFVLMMMMMTIVAANLLDRWSLPDSPTYSSGDNNNGGGSGGWNFIMEYPVSNDIAEADNDMNIKIHVYDNGCRYNEGDTPVELLVGISEEVTFLTTTSESSVARLDLTLGGGGGSSMSIPSLLQEYPSLWTNNEEGQEQVQFCVRFSLSKQDIEVNFLETVMILDIDLVGENFQLNDVSTTLKEKIQKTGRLTYGAKACLCNELYLPITPCGIPVDTNTNTNKLTITAPELMYEVCNSEEEDSGTTTTTTTSTTTTTEEEGPTSTSPIPIAEKLTFPQGSIIHVCVRPDDLSIGQVSIRTIEYLIFETVATSTSSSIFGNNNVYRQSAVEDGSTAVSQGLSDMKCGKRKSELLVGLAVGLDDDDDDDERVCVASTLLSSPFFTRRSKESTSLPDVYAYGAATLEFKKDFNNRRIKNRQLQVQQQRRHSSLLRRREQQQEQQQQQQQRIPQRRIQVQHLDRYWNMTRPSVVFGGGDGMSSGLNFELEYEVSDAITNDMVQIEIWDKNCQLGRGIDDNPLLSLPSSSSSLSSIPSLMEILKTDAIETGDGHSGGTQRFRTTVRWKVEDPKFGQKLSESLFFKESSDGSFAQMSLCVRCQLHTKEQLSNGRIEVNYL